MRSRLLHWGAIILILEIGLLHILTAQAEYEEAPYMGYLFAANFFGSLIAAYAIQHRQYWGWLLGLVVAGGSMAGYAWSRTLGMPGMNVEEWFDPYGVASMSLEGVFILLALFFRPWRTAVPSSPNAGGPISPFAPTLIGLLLILLAAFLTYQWDAAVTRAFGHHVGSLDQVCSTPVTTLADLEEQYGIQVSLVAISMLDGIVDVRIKIIDPDKAHAILQNQAALLVNQESLILAPHMHSHSTGRLKAGKIYVMFFPTEQIVHAGSEVNLVFGSVRVAPVAVR